MLKRVGESVIVVFSESIVYMLSQDEVKSGNRDVSRTESGGKAIGRLRVAGEGNSAWMVGQGSEGEVGVESIRNSGERR